MSVTEITQNLVEPILADLGLELVDIEYVKEGKSFYLRVFIDKEGGVDIEECGLVSERLSESLDEDDPIKDPYYLEVSSPGAERPLKKREDFQKFMHHHVYLKFYEPISGFKAIEGDLVGLSEDDIVTIEYKDKTRKKTLDVPYKKIAKARLAVSFN
ncbi:ribosome maturation factor RimP [Halolactibacillus miurensis]|uniref:Ribosome maturation factor RimP n=1 Tax=Halolactibacillus miurensis TaxID=306541 RepID=A0A1I6QFJ9_9BACI|nr:MULTISPECIES: ribosome maturation factor RimP [Halolactibacillus]GEM03398.1 ribosome maturation factor RimP [Halolactibacillus miurensis]SFS51236.1 ribosome maturation factor RimP [Halolactibacillus miurensis]